MSISMKRQLNMKNTVTIAKQSVKRLTILCAEVEGEPSNLQTTEGSIGLDDLNLEHTKSFNL